ncbi:unnamed protein product, partial [Amoebophrya sp. A25]
CGSGYDEAPKKMKARVYLAYVLEHAKTDFLQKIADNFSRFYKRTMRTEQDG